MRPTRRPVVPPRTFALLGVLVALGSSCASGEPGASSSLDGGRTPPPTIGGTVVDPQGGPVAGARVELVLDATGVIFAAAEADVRGTVVTDVDGRFAFDVEACPVPALFRRDRFVLRVRHDDFAVERATNVAFGDPGSADRKIALSPGGCSVAGVCRDADGAPLAGVEVSAFDLDVATTDPDGAFERAATTAADGSFAIGRLKPGRKRVRAAHAGYATTSLLCTGLRGEGARVRVDVALRPGRTISGSVVAQDTGLGLPGAVVTATPTTLGPPAHVGAVGGSVGEGRRAASDVELPNDLRFAARTFRTDAAGRFEADGLAAGIYELSVRAPGYLLSAPQSAAAGGDSPRFSLLPSARILGRVTDEETGRPVEAFTVGLSPTTDGSFVPYQMKKPFGPPPNPDGAFEYVDVHPGTYVLIAEAPGYAGGRTEQIVIGPSERREGVEIKLARGATVVGKVVDAQGKPVADATVTLEAASVTTGPGADFMRAFTSLLRRDVMEARTLPDGAYRLTNVLDGRYVVQVRHPDFAPYDDGEAFEVPRRGEAAAPACTLTRGAGVRGRVLRKDGSPDAGATVEVQPTAERAAYRRWDAAADVDGRFEVSGLAPGEYRLTVPRRRSIRSLPELVLVCFGPPEQARTVTLRPAEIVDIGDFVAGF